MRPRLTIALAACVAASTILTGLPHPAAADVGNDRGGTIDDGQYSAWAYYARATGGGGIRMPKKCTLSSLPDVPAHYEYNVISYDGGETYTVWYDCVADSEVLEDAEGLFPDDLQTWDVIDSWVVTPADPHAMIAEAVSRLNPVPPAIETDPGGAVAGMVGITTYLSFTQPLGRQTASMSDGPIRVDVWADPAGEVTWDTGDGLVACNAPAGPEGECTHIYEQSSIGAGATRNGLPAYTITAEITYTGGYAVYANGAHVGGSDDIGDILRVSETTLAVTEAQAINTSAT